MTGDLSARNRHATATTEAPVPPRLWGPWALVVWTLAVWATRIRNIATDDALDGFELVWRTGLAVALSLAAAAGVGALLRRQGRRPVIGFLVALTVITWVSRAIGIAGGGHSVAFVTVHLVLAAISIGLAGWAWRSLPPGTSVQA